MTPDSITHSASSLLVHVLDPALRSLLLGTVVAAALGLLRVKNPAIRLSVWTAVLYAVLAMPLLELALPRISFSVPAGMSGWFAGKMPSVSAAPVAPTAIPSNEELSQTAAIPDFAAPRVRQSRSHANATHETHALVLSDAIPVPLEHGKGVQLVPSVAPVQPVASRPFPWMIAAAALYCIGVLFFLARLAVGVFFSGKLMRSAQRIGDCDAIRILIGRACTERLSTSPELAESDLVSVPVTLGIARPVIVLPSYWRTWDEAALAAVIAHEMSHIARRDALTQRLALLYSALFWFSPLAWWMNRALVDAAEEASDEAALVAGADRTFYAETLLEFFGALGEDPRRVYWQGVSMAAKGQAERRLDRILNWKGALSMRIQRSLAVMIAVFGIPAVMLAAAAHPAAKADSSSPALNSLLAQQTAPPPAPMLAVPVAPGQAAPRAIAPPEVPDAPVIAQTPESAPQLLPPSDDTPEPLLIVPAVPLDRRATRGPGSDYSLQRKDLTELQGQIASARLKALTDSLGTQVSKQLSKQLGDAGKEMQFEFNDAFAEANQELQQELQSLSTGQIDGRDVEKRVAQLQRQFRLQAQQATPVPPAAPAGPVPPATAVMRGPMFNVGNKVVTIGDSSDRYVIVSSNTPMFMNGDSQDLEHATGLRGKISGDFIWFQRDEKSYVIRDQEVVNRAKALFKPMQDLGDQQAVLGKQQQALGDQQRDLGQKMREVHVAVPDLSADMQKLEAQIKQLSASGATQEQMGDLQRQLGDLMRRLGETQHQAGDQQGQIGSQMRDLGQKQRDLGEQQRDLGHKERDASKEARAQMRQLFDDAISKGTAQPE